MNNHLSDTAWFVWYFSQANCCFFYNPALAQKDPKTGKVNSRVEGCSGWDPDDPITEELARRHLEEGSVGAGTPTTDGKFAVKFAALDYDSWDISPPELAKRIKDRGLRGVVCRTRSGRGRVFLPFVEPVEVETTYKMMEILRDLLDLPKDPHITEIFPGLPKKGQAPEAFIKGSNLWLPYRKGSAECAIDPETGEDVPFSTFRQMWGKWLTTKHMVESWVKQYAQAADQSGEFDAGDDANARVAKMLETRCAILAGMKDGEGRNTFLQANSRAFFGYAATGYITDEDVEKAFTDAALACGLDPGAIRDVLRRMKKSGHAAPLKYKVKKERKRKGKSNIDDEPGIRIIEGELPRVVDEAEQALLDASVQIYQRAGRLIRPMVIEIRGFNNEPTKSWCLTEISLYHLKEEFTRASVFWKEDMRAGWVKTNCSKDITETYMARAGYWRVRTMHTVVNVPVLMLDGAIIDKPGLHDSGIFFEPENVDFGPMPINPSRADAEEALQLLLDLVSTFPFMSKLDRSVVIAMFMTVVLRPVLPTSPMFGITAYEAGSGKTKLAEMAGCIANGRVTSATNISRDEQEFEKGLKSALLSGRSIIGFDNLDRPLESGLLCTALTARGNFEVRGFGALKDITCVNTATIIATGNNLEIKGDLIRRTLLCALDPGCAHPEQRQFTNDPVQDTLTKRIDLVRAIITIARAYQQADRVHGVTPLGNFEEWSRMVREAIIWLGMDDPCKTGERIEKTDKDTNNLREVIERWPDRNTFIGDVDKEYRPGTVIVRTKEFSTSELIKWSRGGYVSGSYTPQQPLFETFLNIAPSKKDGEIDPTHLGNWFKKRKGKFVGRDRLMSGQTKNNRTNVGRWVIERHLSEDEYEKILLASLNGKGSNGHAVNGNDVKQQVTLPGIIDHDPHEDDEERTIM